MKLAFIDLDHTLMRNPFSRGVFPHFTREVAQRSPLHPEPDQVYRDLIARSELLRAQRSFSCNDWDHLTKESATAFGVHWSEDVSRLVEVYVDSACEELHAREMLSSLRRDGWTCIATSEGFRRYQVPVLRHLGLLDLFHGALFADDVRLLKRNRLFYGEIGPEVTHVASVGDKYIDDCLYPRWFGFLSVWYIGAHKDQEVPCGSPPHLVVDDLAAISSELSCMIADSQSRYRRAYAHECPRCRAIAVHFGLCELCRCLEAHVAGP